MRSWPRFLALLAGAFGNFMANLAGVLAVLVVSVGIIWPVWFFATQQPRAYTIIALGLGGVVAIRGIVLAVLKRCRLVPLRTSSGGAGSR